MKTQESNRRSRWWMTKQGPGEPTRAALPSIYWACNTITHKRVIFSNKETRITRWGSSSAVRTWTCGGIKASIFWMVEIGFRLTSRSTGYTTLILSRVWVLGSWVLDLQGSPWEKTYSILPSQAHNRATVEASPCNQCLLCNRTLTNINSRTLCLRCLQYKVVDSKDSQSGVDNNSNINNLINNSNPHNNTISSSSNRWFNNNSKPTLLLIEQITGEDSNYLSTSNNKLSTGQVAKTIIKPQAVHTVVTNSKPHLR